MRKIAYLLTLILLFFLPFHPFLSVVADAFLPVNETVLTILKAWKEIIGTILIIIGGYFWIRYRKHYRVHALDLCIFAFCLLSVITGVLFTGNGFPENLSQLLWGAKYGLFFFVVFLFVQKIPFLRREKKMLFGTAMLSGAIVLLFGLLQAFVLPENILVSAGYSSEYGNTEVAQNGRISYCHKIENAITHEEKCRVQSTLSGPNQLGAYILLLLPLFLYGAWQSRKKTLAFLLYGMSIAAYITLLFTWSRSAWIGAMLILTGLFIIQAKKPHAALFFLVLFAFGIISLFFPALFITHWDALKWWSLGVSLVFFLALSIILLKNAYVRHFPLWGGAVFLFALGGALLTRMLADTFFWNIILRPSSSQGHWERWMDGVRFIVKNPFGLGLGDAGPASARFALPGQTGFLPESWYLQVGLESGVLGLLLFVCILILSLRAILASRQPFSRAIALAIVGVSTAALFLHSWESAAVALSIWTLAGVSLSPDGILDKKKRMA